MRQQMGRLRALVARRASSSALAPPFNLSDRERVRRAELRAGHPPPPRACYLGAMNHRMALAAGIAALSSPFLSCQATLTVGPGGYIDVNAAIAAANPGDTIVVLPGTYPAFLMSKGVLIRPAVPGTVTFAVLFPVVGAQVPAGQTGHLVGLQLPGVLVSGGRLSIIDCTIAPGRLSVMSGALVVVEGTTIAVFGVFNAAAIYADQSEIVTTDCVLTGSGASTIPPINATPAIDLYSSRLHGSRLVLQAGPSLSGPPGAPALRADVASTVWLSDSTLTGDPSSCAIQATNGRHDRCLLTPNCSTLPAGFVLGVHRPQPLQNGSVFTVDFTLQPGMAVGICAAGTFAPQMYSELEQSLLLPVATAFALTTVVADAQGIATAAWLVPAGPQFLDRTLWIQGFSGFALPLQASPLTGGVVR